MRRIEINVVESREPRAKHKYHFYFERNKILKFTSKRKAKDFSVQLEKTLNYSVRSLLELNKQLYSMHLENYMQMEKLTCIRLKREFDSFLSGVDRIYQSNEIGNPFQFTAIRFLFSQIKTIALITKQWSDKNNNYNVNARLNSILKSRDLIANSYDIEISSHEIDFSYIDKKIKIIHLKHSNKNKDIG